ncbi:alpha/beta hydrolase family protein [Paenisporosarcina indica]|uniref:alpha/beta hydrolase family protein n=1 Tax=Paenisporosarcina indica TaxID=650093 RepID=UPI00094F6F2B|nr:alpha/beta fold hydrolase [Paenisporosarcina indica]
MKKAITKQFVSHIYNSEQKSVGKTIMIFHGWGSSVNNYIELANLLSTFGFRVILPEIVFHDSRNKLGNHFAKEVTQEYFWKVIMKTIDEANHILEELDIRKEEVILMGVSMGGFIANGIFVNGHKFAGLINVNGSGSFLLSEEIFRENDHRPEMTTDEINVLREYDPKGKKTKSSPILLMHGEQDTVVSIEGQKNYLTYLTEGNRIHDVVFNTYKDVNHSFSEEMIENLIQWLIKKFHVDKGVTYN